MRTVAMANELETHAPDIIKDVSHVQHVDFASESRTPSKERTVNFFLLLTCAAFGSASLVFGFDDKIISPVAALAPFVDKYQGPEPLTGKLVLTARNQSILFSIPLIGSILGGLAASPLNSRLGRKCPLLIAYIISIGGSLLQVLAPNLGAFVSGRFINGIATGIANSTAPLYLAEVVPASMRGRSVSLINILTLVAGVLGTIVVLCTHDLRGSSSYRIPLTVQCVLPALLFIWTLPLPESPQWLVSKCRLEPARSNLRRLRCCSEQRVDEELRDMELSEGHASDVNVSFMIIFSKKHLQRTLTAGSFYSLNQVSGIILSTTYSTVFLSGIGIGDPFTLTVIASCCTLAGTIAAPFMLDRAGRRPTALAGMSILFVIDLAAGGLAFNKGNRHSAIAIAALSFAFNFFWASSFSPISTLLPSEMATPKLRHHTMAYTIACAQTTAVITTLVVPQLTAPDAANLGPKTYLVFAGCMACILIFAYLFIPETKGRTFVEIDAMYNANIPARKWRQYWSSLEKASGSDPQGSTKPP
ncbi:sugar transporter [Aspergillus eucalypticola CBS 122712]|uniref:Sugar transporter n=1 Tax=Aspergillus eucalypticola (strain CBS 122712 / IBT 29274) TaxID=1448314 RepID=A0A317VZ53_ASPEC|nr:sugar transporter [Aspergillus eucalypticola CBS 122712]PWY78601.1 sugar transporter [Aspergillus eucalypticola CBS 122712]